jgi:hypothetical protein
MGLLGMLCVYAATTMVMSGAASLPGVGFRTAGIALGAWFMHWLTRQDPDRVRYDLGELVPWAVPVYLVLLLAVNGLLSLTWSTEGPPLGGHPLLPLYNYYIVSKAQAAKDIAGHLAMYAPVGIMIWLRSTRAGGQGTAFFLAALLSAIVEGGRYLRPGLVPDINAVPLAGIAAWGAAALMPILWRMLSPVAIGRPALISSGLPPGLGAAPAVSWRDRNIERRTRRRQRDERNPQPEAEREAGDIEHY